MNNMNSITKEQFFRNIENYVCINNDVYRMQYDNPNVLNPTPITKQVFVQKFGFSNEQWAALPPFDGFTNEPVHLDYVNSVRGKWNLYHKVDWHPTPGPWPTIEKLINHLYGENSVEKDQVEELYDYHTVLVKWPKQKQQARILYSHTQGTSKSALAVLESYMFQSNYTKIRDSELSGDFNGIWVRSLIIHLDEPYFLYPQSISRKLRDVVTADVMNLRKMKTDHAPIPFFGKLLFTTNDSNFMPIGAGDRRYWVREVPTFAKEDEDPHFNEKMKAEVNHYLYFLLTRKMKYAEKSDKTFWLPFSAISNSNAFQKMVSDSKSPIEVACTEILENWFIKHPTELQVSFRLKDMRQLVAHELKIHFKDVSQTDVVIILRDVLKIEQPLRNTRPNKNDAVLSYDIAEDGGREAGKWWIAERKDFNVVLSIFDDVAI